MSADLPSQGDQRNPRHPTTDEVVARLERLWTTPPHSDHIESRPRERGAQASEPREELFSELASRLVDRITARDAAPNGDEVDPDAEIADLLRQAFSAPRGTDGAIEFGSDVVLDGTRRFQLGEFRLLREIGRGGMGIVYEAEQLSLGRRVALKVLPFAAMLGREQLNRFKNEARAAATLDHPNIVAIHSVGTDRGVHYYAMQLVDGCSLAQLIARMRTSEGGAGRLQAAGRDALAESDTPPLATLSTLSSAAPRQYYRTVAEIGSQAARALDHAHANGILHRDVKPANLLVDDAGKLWVTDFGLARIAAAPEVTMSGDLLGTVGYMSPEQALGRRSEVGERSDIYSLGATLYELATLRPLFGHVERPTLLHAIAHREPVRPRVIKPDMPRDLETILLKATSKEPAQRYASAAEMAGDLDRFCKNQTIRARRPTVIDQLGKWSRRHQPLVITLVLALIVLSIVSAGSALLVNRARSQTQTALSAAEKNAHRLGELLYATDMQLAYDAWDKGWPDQARAVLERQRPGPNELDWRGVEWQLLHNLTLEPASFALLGHQGPVNEVATFPDGQRVASAGADGTLRIWDAPQRRLEAAFPLGDEEIHAVAVSKSGRYVAAGSSKLHVIDRRTGTCRALLSTKATIESLAFLADDQSIAVGSRYEQVDIVSLEGKLLNSIPSNARHESLHFLPQSETLLMPTRRDVPEKTELGVIELRSGDYSRVQRAWNPHDYDNVPRGNFVMAAASPCERFVACGDRYSARFAIFFIPTGEQVAVVAPLRSKMTNLAYSPGGDSVAAAFESGLVRVWNLQPRETDDVSLDPLAQLITAHQGDATCVRYLDAQTLVTAGEDGAVRVWDLDQQAKTLRLGRRNAVPYDLSFSPDGKQVAVACDEDFAIYNARDGSQLFHEQRPRSDFFDVCWAPDGSRVAVASPHSGSVELFDVQTLKFQAHLAHGEHIDDVAISPNGRHLASIGWDSLRIWDLESQRQLVSYPLPDYGYTVAYSPTGRSLAYAGRFGRIVVRDVPENQISRELACPSDTNCVVFSRDGLLLVSGHEDSAIRLWDLATGSMVGELSGHERPIQDLALFSNDRILASASTDGTVRLWNLRLNRPVGVVHRGLHIRSLDVSPNGKRLAAGVSYADGRRLVMVWPLVDR